MSYLGIVVTAVFASNALLSYGLGSIPGEKREGREAPIAALALCLANCLASCLLWTLHSLVLSPLRLASLDILLFVLLAVPLLKFVAKAAANSGKALLARLGGASDRLIVGSLVYGVAFISANSGFSLPQALAASLASGLGYWLAGVLLEAIRERLELSELPRPFRAGPSLLVSAGLIALALMGIDSAFVKGLGG